MAAQNPPKRHDYHYCYSRATEGTAEGGLLERGGWGRAGGTFAKLQQPWNPLTGHISYSCHLQWNIKHKVSFLLLSLPLNWAIIPHLYWGRAQCNGREWFTLYPHRHLQSTRFSRTLTGMCGRRLIPVPSSSDPARSAVVSHCWPYFIWLIKSRSLLTQPEHKSCMVLLFGILI